MNRNGEYSSHNRCQEISIHNVNNFCPTHGEGATRNCSGETIFSFLDRYEAPSVADWPLPVRVQLTRVNA